jgi:hypothetical protein
MIGLLFLNLKPNVDSSMKGKITGPGVGSILASLASRSKICDSVLSGSIIFQFLMYNLINLRLSQAVV